MPTFVIYVPGLGDHKSYGQDKAIRLWRLFGLKTRYLPLGWANSEDFETKLSRLLELIDRLRSQGHEIVLVGVSAGASAVLAAYAKRPREIKAVICICGKIHNPQTIGDRTYRRNPDFKEAMSSVETSLKKLEKNDLLGSIMSIYSWRDGTVLPADSKIDGATNKALLGWSHASGIFWGVIFGGALIKGFLRRRGKKRTR